MHPAKLLETHKSQDYDICNDRFLQANKLTKWPHLKLVLLLTVVLGWIQFLSFLGIPIWSEKQGAHRKVSTLSALATAMLTACLAFYSYQRRCCFF